MEKKLLTPEEVCEVLGIRMSKFRSVVFKKEIPIIKVGRLVRVCSEDLKKWIENNRH